MNEDALIIVRRFYLIMKRAKERRTHLSDTVAQLYVLYEDVQNLFHITDLFPDANDSKGPVGKWGT